jgi:hypothetical protein
MQHHDWWGCSPISLYIVMPKTISLLWAIIFRKQRQNSLDSYARIITYAIQARSFPVLLLQPGRTFASVVMNSVHDTVSPDVDIWFGTLTSVGLEETSCWDHAYYHAREYHSREEHNDPSPIVPECRRPNKKNECKLPWIFACSTWTAPCHPLSLKTIPMAYLHWFCLRFA